MAVFPSRKLPVAARGKVSGIKQGTVWVTIKYGQKDGSLQLLKRMSPGAGSGWKFNSPSHQIAGSEDKPRDLDAAGTSHLGGRNAVPDGPDGSGRLARDVVMVAGICTWSRPRKAVCGSGLCLFGDITGHPPFWAHILNQGLQSHLIWVSYHCPSRRNATTLSQHGAPRGEVFLICNARSPCDRRICPDRGVIGGRQSQRTRQVGGLLTR